MCSSPNRGIYQAVKLPADFSPFATLAGDPASWLPFVRAWCGELAVESFLGGWTRLLWRPDRLRFEAVLSTRQPPGNRATMHNDRTWELGDTCEFFLAVPGEDRYLEVHVTPEGRRLQLQWTTTAFAEFRRTLSFAESDLIADPRVFHSESVPAVWNWHVALEVPAGEVADVPLAAGQEFDFAVCRYDTSDGLKPVLSSTAQLSHPDFHRRAEWNRCRLIA